MILGYLLIGNQIISISQLIFPITSNGIIPSAVHIIPLIIEKYPIPGMPSRQTTRQTT